MERKIMVTRFDNKTFLENSRWRENNNYKGCIYNCPTLINSNIPLLSELFIIEMNNSLNEIIAIGKIINKINFNQKFKIYEENNYNRYTYKGKYRINREDIKYLNIEELENILFKGKSHLKRGQGITAVPIKLEKKILNDIKLNFDDIKIH